MSLEKMYSHDKKENIIPELQRVRDFWFAACFIIGPAAVLIIWYLIILLQRGNDES